MSDDGSYSVELGDDETGHVVSVKNEHAAAYPSERVTYSLDLYLVPQDTEIPVTGAGDDISYNNMAPTTSYGGAGKDRFVLTNEGQAFGEAGDDFFNLDSGTVADGGGGDDHFQMVRFADTAQDTEAVVTGGAGADTYDFHVRNAFVGTDGQYMRITDFDPDEDVLMNDGWGDTNLSDVRIQEAPDGSYTDVIAEFRNPGANMPGAGPSTATIRLEGVSGFTVAQLLA